MNYFYYEISGKMRQYPRVCSAMTHFVGVKRSFQDDDFSLIGEMTRLKQLFLHDVEIDDYSFLTEEFTNQEQVGSHIRKGDITAFCTGTGGDFALWLRSGYPDSNAEKEFPVMIRQLYGVEELKGYTEEEIAVVKQYFDPLPSTLEEFWKLLRVAAGEVEPKEWEVWWNSHSLKLEESLNRGDRGRMMPALWDANYYWMAETQSGIAYYFHAQGRPVKVSDYYEKKMQEEEERERQKAMEGYHKDTTPARQRWEAYLGGHPADTITFDWKSLLGTPAGQKPARDFAYISIPMADIRHF